MLQRLKKPDAVHAISIVLVIIASMMIPVVGYIDKLELENTELRSAYNDTRYDLMMACIKFDELYCVSQLDTQYHLLLIEYLEIDRD